MRSRYGNIDYIGDFMKPYRRLYETSVLLAVKKDIATNKAKIIKVNDIKQMTDSQLAEAIFKNAGSVTELEKSRVIDRDVKGEDRERINKKIANQRANSKNLDKEFKKRDLKIENYW